MSQDIGDKFLDVAGVSLDLVQICKFSLLVLQDLEGLLQPHLEGGALASELGQLLQSSRETFDELVRVAANIVISRLELFAIGLKFVEFSSAENISTSLNQLSNDVQGIVDGTIVIVNIILDLLQEKKHI